MKNQNETVLKTNPKRNFKIFNHWIAEVRDIAFGQIVNEDGKVMSMSDVRWTFTKSLMEDYFSEGYTPQEAFETETSHWD